MFPVLPLLWVSSEGPQETTPVAEEIPRSSVNFPPPEEPRRPSSRPWWYRFFLWRGRLPEAFWTVAALVSISLNIVLLVALVVLARHLFAIKAVVEDQLLGGLAANFQAMDEAVIRTTVVVEDTIPVKFDLPVAFDLPIETETEVVLTEEVFIPGAEVRYLSTGGLLIRNAPADIVLPSGVSLPVRLRLTVPVRVTIPVDTRIPVHLNVPVAIPLKETELHEPFVGLQEVVAPYQHLLGQLPDSWQEALCGPDRPAWLCRLADWLEPQPNHPK